MCSSDLFFLDSSKAHGFGALFLEAFWTHLKPPSDLNWSEILRVLREDRTENGKRPDIIVDSSNWVLFIENKIRHVQDNPFKEYERHASQAFNGKTPFFCVLSPSGISNAPPNWIGISYGSYLRELRALLGTTLLARPFSKWDVFAREIILHLENQATEHEMEPRERAFAEENYTNIVRMAALRDSYVTQLAEEGKQRLNAAITGITFECKREDWGEGYDALVFWSEKWGGRNDGTVVFLHLWNTSVNGITAGLWVRDASFAPIKRELEKVGARPDYTTPETGWQCWVSPLQKTVDLALNSVLTLAKIAARVAAPVVGEFYQDGTK